MKSLALLTALLLAPIGAHAACSTHTIIQGAKIVTCTTCCFNGNCTTTCL